MSNRIDHQKRAYITENVTKMTNDQMAAVLGISPDGVKHYVQELKLAPLRAKSPSYQMLIAEQRRKKNKTMFQKGMIAPNLIKEMQVSFNKNKGFVIKYKGKVMPIKHAVWMANHKTEIPKGMIIKVVDGNPHNLAIDNLQLIDKYQNLMIACISKIETSSIELFELVKAAANHRKQLNTQINEK